jgi:hypothetical protein
MNRDQACRIAMGGLAFLLIGCGSVSQSGGASDGGLSDAQATPLDAAAEGGFPDAVAEDAPLDAAAEDSEPGEMIVGTAFGKFCHELNRGGQSVELTMEFGRAPTVRISGRTGVCAPPAGTPCLVIPAGRVWVRLLEGDKELTSRYVVLSAGDEYVFQSVITTTSQVAITGGRIADGTCAGLDFPPPDGGTSDSSMPMNSDSCPVKADSGITCTNVCGDVDEFRRFPCDKPPYMLCNSQQLSVRPLNKAESDYVVEKCRTCAGCSSGCSSCNSGLPPY